MESANELVYVVDDDSRVREARNVRAFSSVGELLDTALLASGLLNKQATAILGITEYIEQVHRGHIMRKMQADSIATLVRQGSKLQLETSSTTTFDA